MIFLNEANFLQLLTVIGTLLGGTFLGNIVSRKNSKEANAQTLIDQIQEERDYTNQQLIKRDEKIDNQNIKIDELYEMYHTLQSDYRKMVEEKKTLEWELANEVKKKKHLIEENAHTLKQNEQALKQELKAKEILRIENDQLKKKVYELEKRVKRLEKEQLMERASPD